MGKYATKNILLHFKIGQSNAVPSALSSGATYPTANANIFIAWKSLIPNPAGNTDDRDLSLLNPIDWQTLSSGVNTGSPKDVQDGVSRGGSELAFGQLLYNNKNVQLHVINAARGGTSLNGDHDPTNVTATSMYILARDVFEEAANTLAYKGRLIPPVLEWDQGESDSTGPGPAGNYAANLPDYFEDNLLTEHPLLAEGVVFIWRTFLTDTVTYPEVETVRTAQVGYTPSRNFAVFGDKDSMPLQDPLHVNQVGQESKGTAMYDWVNLQSYIDGNV